MAKGVKVDRSLYLLVTPPLLHLDAGRARLPSEELRPRNRRKAQERSAVPLHADGK